MNESDLRKKIENLGEGSFEDGADTLYDYFVGLRGFFGINSRFRPLESVERVLTRVGLVCNQKESQEFMENLILNPLRYDGRDYHGDSFMAEVRVAAGKKEGREGYILTRKVQRDKPYY